MKSYSTSEIAGIIFIMIDADIDKNCKEYLLGWTELWIC